MKHALYSPSESEQWLNCDGYVAVKLQNVFVNPERPHMARGKRFHEIVSDFVQAEYVDNKKFICDDEEVYEEHIKPLKRYLDSLYNIIEVRSEKTLDNGGNANFFGTPDLVVLSLNEDSKVDVHVIDVKAGYVPVKAYKNTQLVCYLYLALQEFKEEGYEYNNYNLVILQPPNKYNGGNVIDSWVIKSSDKSKDYIDIVKKIESKTIQSSSTRGNKSMIDFKFGKHCTYCKARLMCPSFLLKLEEVYS